MNLIETGEIHGTIRQSRWTSLVEDLEQAAVRYARMRVDWLLASRDERRTMDGERTRAHDAFIDCCDILSRNMHETGEDNGWRARIGTDRKSIGDFACWLHCWLGIQAR
jgi:hypothetical protein